jgi:hypothetical protein
MPKTVDCLPLAINFEAGPPEGALRPPARRRTAPRRQQAPGPGWWRRGGLYLMPPIINAVGPWVPAVLMDLMRDSRHRGAATAPRSRSSPRRISPSRPVPARRHWIYLTCRPPHMRNIPREYNALTAAHVLRISRQRSSAPLSVVSCAVHKPCGPCCLCIKACR